MPPSLSVSVGVPPATVTASLKFIVRVTVLPASRSPLEGDSTTDDTVGPVEAVAATTASMMPPFSPEDAVATKPAWVADTILYSDRYPSLPPSMVLQPEPAVGLLPKNR